MKILTVVYDLDKGGTQRAAQNFCEAYKALGHDSQLIAVYAGGPREQELKVLGISVYVTITPEFIKHLRDWDPDIIHLHSHALKKVEVYKLKEVCPRARMIETNVFSCLSDYSENSVEYSFQLSAWCNYLYHSRGGSTNKSVIIPNPVKTQPFKKSTYEDCQAFRQKYNIPGDAFVLGRIGQKHFAKWSYYLVDIFQKFSEEVNANSCLLLVNAHESLISYAKDKGLLDKIILIDVITGDQELAQCYSTIDLFLHISTQGESFGYALAESLLCETPVIAYNTPWSDNSQSEVIGDRVGGYCANSRKEFFKFIKTLYFNEKLRHELGKRGREKIINDYNYTVVAQKVIDIMTRENTSSKTSPISSLVAIRNLSFIKKNIVRILLWIKLKHEVTHRGSNFVLKKLYNHKIYY
ncbi:hypothetical protein GCM10028803_23870 [Larkinella knui]|uniref:Glycosyltransferase n=1 Tax=Larkinella knui TaxID=2025310 RepID=A0A3P1CVM8_9BACT|nr:glycosyltransferase [Larkinella knui]RRB17452.1 glycosyltransferase [Larkinella knui]